MNRCKLGLLALLSVAALASAQFSRPTNARISSMGGAFIVDDITDVFRYPVTMLDYRGQLQATFNAPIIGVRNSESMFTLGATANRGNVLRNYYGDAIGVTDPAFGNMVNLPHVLLGFDLGSIQLGADAFVEYSRLSSKTEDEALDMETSVSGMVVIPGVIASARFGSESLPIMVKAGIAFPNTSGEGKVTMAGSTTTSELSTKKGLYLETGAEAKTSMLGLDWTLGLGYTFESYQFEEDDVSTNPVYNSNLSGYLGFELGVLEDGIAAVQYQFNQTHPYDYQDVDGNSYARNDTVSHVFNMGLEKGWENVWVLNSFQLRGGMNYGIIVPYVRDHSESDLGNSDTREKYPAFDTELFPTVGFGLSKGFLQLDMTINMGTWGGFFTGPDVGAVTATMKF